MLSSHSHADHFNPEVLEWKVMHPDVQYVFSTDILENGLARLNDACYLSKGETWSDGVLEVEAFWINGFRYFFSFTAGWEIDFSCRGFE